MNTRPLVLHTIPRMDLPIFCQGCYLNSMLCVCAHYHPPDLPFLWTLRSFAPTVRINHARPNPFGEAA
jgi:hypothetical protein